MHWLGHKRTLCVVIETNTKHCPSSPSKSLVGLIEILCRDNAEVVELLSPLHPHIWVEKFKDIIQRQRNVAWGQDYLSNAEFFAQEMLKIKIRNDPSFKDKLETYRKTLKSNTPYPQTLTNIRESIEDQLRAFPEDHPKHNRNILAEEGVSRLFPSFELYFIALKRNLMMKLTKACLIHQHAQNQKYKK